MVTRHVVSCVIVTPVTSGTAAGSVALAATARIVPNNVLFAFMVDSGIDNFVARLLSSPK